MFKKILRNSVFRKVIIFCMRLVSILNIIVPKNDKAILFYDGTNRSLVDNSEAFLCYLIQNGFANNYKIVVSLPANKKANNYGIKTIGAIRGVLCFLRSKYVFYSFGDMRIKPTKKQVVVNFWHGMPFKRIGKLSSDKDYQDEVLNSFTYVVATSDFFVPVLAKAFDVNERQVLINGNCRCDFLQKKTYVLDKVIPEVKQYDRTVLWMPTFRKSTNGRFNDSIGFSSDTGLPVITDEALLQQLNDYCEEKKILIVIKAHRAMSFTTSGKKNVRVFYDEDIQNLHIHLYEFVKDFDALITDYSSIYFDFLLLDRPICFTIDDIENYKNGRGFIVEDPTNYMPGDRVTNYQGIVSFLNDLTAGIDHYQMAREEIKNLFNKEKDNACDRLADKIGLKSGKEAQ